MILRQGRPRGPGWEAQLAQLAAYKAAHGDCNVPWGWAEDPRLGRWVSTQWMNKRKLDRGESSDLFVFDSIPVYLGKLIWRVARKNMFC